MPKAQAAAVEPANPETLPDLALGAPAEPAESAAAEPAAEPESDLQAELVDELPAWGNWRYTGEHVRIYASVPVTAEPGDVVHHYGPPATDGMWEPTDEPATRHPDNHRPDLADNPAPASAAALTVKEG